jgi:wyosine [tRNA(Phe)-imidazoG37] synthetase (radical SAM superfamily)
VFDYVRAVRNFVLEGDGQPADPIRIDIDITQKCNAHCVFCFSAHYRNGSSSSAVIELDDLARWMRELGNRGQTKTIRLCGGGEPLAHPRIADILPLAHQFGLRQTLITNLDLVDERVCRSVFEHVDHLRWSANAVSEATRAAVHRPRPGSNSLARSFEFARKLVEWRQRERGGQRRPMIWATFLLVPRNAAEIGEFASTMRAIGVDSVSFRPVRYPVDVTWSPLEHARLRIALDNVSRLDCPPHFRVFTPRTALDNRAILAPSAQFSDCLSRRFRTLVEATAGGPTLQTCGLWRGSGCHAGHRIDQGESFRAAWARVSAHRLPLKAPFECPRCIDMSMNRTLAFISDTLGRDPRARFRRAYAPSPTSEVSQLLPLDD